MTNAQTEARAIETQAWNCDEWPEWLHKIVDETNEVADRLDMSAEQAHAYAVLVALAAKDAELARRDMQLEASAKVALDLSAQLAEANKALEEIADAKTELTNRHDYSRGWNDALFRVRQIARRAREQGGENNG